MTQIADRGFNHLAPAVAGLGGVFARPRTLAVLCVVVLTALGWLYLALLTVGPGRPGAFEALCRQASYEPSGVANIVLAGSMWGAMAFAMMLPSAAPMILAYTEIADTAARKGGRIVSPFAIAAGYLTVWLGFAAAATLVQTILIRASFAEHTPVSDFFPGALFVGAGLYQFSTLKHACLTQCQRPFPFFFTNWTTTPRGIFRLGFRQGLYCLGCCWAMMLVMFAAGAMNVVWMSALAVAMTIEKIGVGNRVTYAIGGGLIAIGATFVLTAVAAHWPGRMI